MTPKEKAIELRDKYIFTTFIIDEDYENIKLKLMLHAKECALIAADELINQCWSYREIDLGIALEYWMEVKQEIEKL
jgi:hypothetical protein